METDIGNPLNIILFFKKFQRRKMKVTRNTLRSITFIHLIIHRNHHLIKVKNHSIYSRMLINQTWIIAFAVFLLGFFMGKTMQPVILRYT